MGDAPAQSEIVSKGKEWCKLISKLLAEKKFKTAPTKIFPKGLASVQDGFKYMIEGNVHAEKIVYRIADTP
jgi:hypothetical protein